MLILERRVARVIRYRRVFFPRNDQLVELVKHLRPFDVLRVFFAPAASLNGIRPICEAEGETTIVDLSKSLDAIYAGMHTNCRYKVRRADKMRGHIDIIMNTEVVHSDFLALYNNFVRAKRGLRILTPRRLDEYLPHADVFMLYFDGQPTCGRLVLRDMESRTALMKYSGTRRLDEGVDTITIGLLNRYLHWHEIKTYHAAGVEKYDFGGAGSANPSITQFKRSFGGHMSTYHYALYAGTPRVAWKLAHSLYTRWTEGPEVLNSVSPGELLSVSFGDNVFPVASKSHST